MVHDYKIRLKLIAEKIYKCGEFDFVSPSSFKDVGVFEEKFTLQLPEQYKWFITTIANGVISKNEWGFHILDQHDWINYRYWEDEYNPAIPFPLTTRTVYGSKKPSDNDSRFPYETIYDSEGDFVHLGYRFGEISLVSDGCGADDFLVVKGPEYGNVWMDNISSNQEVYPAFDKTDQSKKLGGN